ncbi:hypothetical protein PROFUN_05290 [Planoprotostelium fungivorum]|uniref:Uncharacterized protein n=1 Tax=Planoprotostelium fungivorum TaxID=1890364 RepID=A0A2P6NRJ1_9EUKA|nr:hypothetical protein PROFUN_05290 [Planoprotostelium fungivorum]
MLNKKERTSSWGPTGGCAERALNSFRWVSMTRSDFLRSMPTLCITEQGSHCMVFESNGSLSTNDTLFGPLFSMVYTIYRRDMQSSQNHQALTSSGLSSICFMRSFWYRRSLLSFETDIKDATAHRRSYVFYFNMASTSPFQETLRRLVSESTVERVRQTCEL